MKEHRKSLDDIFKDFDASEAGTTDSKKAGAPVTIWLPVEYKAAYDRLQKMSGRRFSRKVRELIQTAIDRTEKRAS